MSSSSPRRDGPWPRRRTPARDRCSAIAARGSTSASARQPRQNREQVGDNRQVLEHVDRLRSLPRKQEANRFAGPPEARPRIDADRVVDGLARPACELGDGLQAFAAIRRSRWPRSPAGSGRWLWHPVLPRRPPAHGPTRPGPSFSVPASSCVEAVESGGRVGLGSPRRQTNSSASRGARSNSCRGLALARVFLQHDVKLVPPKPNAQSRPPSRGAVWSIQGCASLFT